MTFRTLLNKMRQFASDHPDHESLDVRIVMRLRVDDDLHVGGLDSMSVDAGCTEVFALVLDGSDRPDEDDERGEG